jgi:hypothetical protein
MTLWRQVEAHADRPLADGARHLPEVRRRDDSGSFSAPPRLHARARRPAHPLSHAALRIIRRRTALNRLNNIAFEKNGIAMRDPTPMLLAGTSQGAANPGNQLEPEALLARRRGS